MLKAVVALSARDPVIVSVAARALEEVGFEILRVGSRSVAFQGDRPLFEEAFNSPVDLTDETATFVSEPRLPTSLPDEVEFVYFTRKPTLTA